MEFRFHELTFSKLRLPLFAIALCSVFLFACDKEDEEPEKTCDVTYDGQIAAFMERTCSYEGCHAAGFFKGDYTTYDNVVAAIGGIEARVFTVMDMPPPYTPDGNPKSLTAEEQEQLMCWIDNGTPRN